MKRTKKALVTGSAGLIGSESVRFFCGLGFDVVGIDNDLRKYFFGEEASTAWNRQLLEEQYGNYSHLSIDIRDEGAINDVFKQHKFDLIIHAAAQPSHDWAAREPITDFSVNAVGTLILLEAFRKHSPEAPFIFMSTNKVYGDAPNELPLVELETRWEIDPKHEYKNGISETMSIDDSKHSVFGASKVAADIMCQEYGKYFDLPICTFRGGCLTGPSHSGTALHGYLAYLTKCIAEGIPYTIFGYKGKQVRDNIHSADLIRAFYEFYKAPRRGEAYNMGGSRFSNISMMEAIEKVESYFGKKGNFTYSEQNRSGDHIWYVSDVSKFKNHYPNWKYEYNIDAIIKEICEMGHFSKPEVGRFVVSRFGDLSKEKIFVSAHVTEAFGPVQALKSYLIKRASNVVYVEHPFTYSGISKSTVDTYRSGLLSYEKESFKAGSELLSYIADFVLTLYWFIRRGGGCKIFIGVDNLNALVGVFLKKLGFGFKLIYYSVDYSPVRFSNRALNTIYHLIDRVCVRNADFVWNSSERILAVRKQQGLPDNRNILVKNSVTLPSSDVDIRVKKDKNLLVVSEYLTEDKGVQLIIGALKEIRKVNSNARLMVIGTGPYKDFLEQLAKEKKVAKYVEFKGVLQHEERLNVIARCGIGLVLHKGAKDNTVYYSDPVSPKEFLAAGLPVVVTDALWLSDDVSKNGLGESIPYNDKSLIAALEKVWSDNSKYGKLSARATIYAKDYLQSDTIDLAFSPVGLKYGKRIKRS